MAKKGTGSSPEGDAERQDLRAARRERRVQATQDEIRAAAWAQVSELGASSLSLRGVAASIGLSPPAMYRYFPSKAHLVTSLIVEAYNSLADSLSDALKSNPILDWKDVFRGLALAYRAWALEKPEAFYLIFGDPIPGYQAPEAEVAGPASRTLSALIATLAMARDAGELSLPLTVTASPVLESELANWNDTVHHTHPDLLYLAFVIGTRVQGLMLVELGRQLPSFITDANGLYRREIERIIQEVSCNG